MTTKSAKRFPIFGTLLALALIALLAANWMGFNPFRAADKARPALLVSVQDLSQYHAAVGNFEVVIDDRNNDVQWLPEFLTGQRTLFVASGTVNAYVDLGGLTEENLKVSEDGKTATVRLPEAQLDKPNLNLQDSYIYDQQRGVGKAITDAFATPDQSKFYQLAEAQIATAAQESELRKTATENTKTMLTGMFKSFGMETTFQD